MSCWRRAPSAASKSSTTQIRAAGGSATLVPLDLRDFAKIDELAAALYERYGRLDILVGNAGEFGMFSPLGHIDPERVERGHRPQPDRQLAPDPGDGPAAARRPGRARDLRHERRRAAAPAPIGAPTRSARPASKTLVRIYAGEIARTKVRANLIDPGVVRTRLRAAASRARTATRLPPPESVDRRLPRPRRCRNACATANWCGFRPLRHRRVRGAAGRGVIWRFWFSQPLTCW